MCVCVCVCAVCVCLRVFPLYVVNMRLHHYSLGLPTPVTDADSSIYQLPLNLPTPDMEFARWEGIVTKLS